MSSTVPNLHRSRDVLIISLLAFHAFTCIGGHVVALYPPDLVPGFLMDSHKSYLATYTDQLVLEQPHWFHFFAVGQVFCQLPATIWSIWGLWQRNPRAPAHLLVWCVIIAGSTFTCVWEFYYNDFGGKMTWDQRKSLIGMYGIYAGIFALVGVDMLWRIQKTLSAVARLSSAGSEAE